MRTKSSLGQNFLKNPGIVRKIIAFAGISRTDEVLEIGPGTGMLTRGLLASASRVVAVEKDDGLYELLARTFSGEPRLELIHGDILEVDLKSLISPGMKVVANLPYNIATRVILRLEEEAPLLPELVVMVQKEVAERICAPVGDSGYSALTVLVAGGFTCTEGFVVGPESFHPRPKVDSRVIRLTPREDQLKEQEREDFRTVVLTAFSQRRKMLRNTLRNLPGITGEMLEPIALTAGISLEKRPQQISWQEYAELGRAYRRALTG
ncbi:MAG: 16S rRNA (adenine(1518)-N(6)/adenine(1519)-N(6))-dimethyltransferase RsmA [Desulfomonilia bacterium]|jgi:16S rRNA (adenine1518-N6/adenine1519-N6)-dimethyltransferase